MREETKKQLQMVMDQAVKDQKIAGMNLMVIKKSQEEVYLQTGYANIKEKKEISRDTIFRLFSMTKPVTAAAVMLLFQRGLLDLTDPVEKFIPGFQNQMVSVQDRLEPVWHPMSIWNLLSMTSGLTYGGESTVTEYATGKVFEEIEKRLYSDTPVSTLEFADMIGRCPLEFQPGTNWKYGVSADILAAVVEKVSGVSYGEFLKKELFEPLEMTDTAFYVPEEKQNRLAMAYQSTENGIMEYKEDSLGICLSMDAAPAYEAGGAGLVSTIDDYSKFTSMLLNKGNFRGKQILFPKTVEFMTTHKLTPQQQVGMDNWVEMNGFSYGNLMRVMTEPWKAGFATVPGEYGWDGWLGCYFANIPDTEMTILMMMQKKDAGTFELTRRLRNVILLAR